MVRSNSASKLAAKAVAVNNSSLENRKVLKRISFSTFEEEYLPEGWDWIIGKSKVDGGLTISISFEEDGEEKVAFASDEVKKMLQKDGANDFNVCWYAPTESESEFIQIQKKAEGYSDRKSLAAALMALKNKKA